MNLNIAPRSGQRLLRGSLNSRRVVKVKGVLDDLLKFGPVERLEDAGIPRGPVDLDQSMLRIVTETCHEYNLGWNFFLA